MLAVSDSPAAYSARSHARRGATASRALAIASQLKRSDDCRREAPSRSAVEKQTRNELSGLSLFRKRLILEMMPLRWCQGAALSSGLLLSALTMGSRSYAENPAEPEKSDSTEETPQKPTTRAPSTSSPSPSRVYSATKDELGTRATDVRVLRSEKPTEAALGESRSGESGERVYRAERPRATARPAGSLIGGADGSWSQLLPWLILSRLGHSWLLPTRASRPSGLVVVDPAAIDRAAEEFAPTESLDGSVFEPTEFPGLRGFAPGLWAW